MNNYNIINKFIGFLIGPVISSFLGFFSTIIITWFLNPEELGKSSYVSLFITLLGLVIYIGFDQSFAREYNEHNNKIEIFWNSVILPLIFSLLFCVIIIIYKEKVSLLIFEETNIKGILYVAFILPFMVFDRFSLLLLRMQEKSYNYSILQIAHKLINIISLIMYLKFVEKSYNGILFANFISMLFISLLEIYILRNVWTSKFKINIDMIKVLLRYGLPLIPNMIVVWMFNSVDRISIKQFSNYTELGIYASAYKIVTMLAIIQGAFSSFWVPVSQRWYKEGVKPDKIMSAANYMSSIIAIVFSGLVIFKDIFVMILSPDYRDAALLIPFLSYVPLLSILSVATCVGINFSRKTELYLISSVISLGVNYFGNIILVPQYGALGAAISTAIAYTIYFTLITIISRLVWYRFKVISIFSTILTLWGLSINTIMFKNNIVALILVCIILYINFENYKYIIKVLKKYIKNILHKSMNKEKV